MAMKPSDYVFAVCPDCDVMKMGPAGLKGKKSFMTCDGCGKAMVELAPKR